MARHPKWPDELIAELRRRYMDIETYPEHRHIYKNFPEDKSRGAIVQQIATLKKQELLPAHRPRAESLPSVLEPQHQPIVQEALFFKGVTLPYVSCLVGDGKYNVIKIIR